jgi:hypothetical protein
MLRKLLLVGAAATVMGAIAAPAQADNIVTDVWYAFGFTSTGTPLFGPGFAAGTSPGGVLAPAGPWTITLSGPATLTVTDVEISGDRFTLFDNGVLLGQTSAPVPNASSVGECISCALADPNYSHGFFPLGPGSHSITGTFDGVITNGDGDFIIHAVGVPEPGAWALMLVGFGGLGAALRSRRRMASAVA